MQKSYERLVNHEPQQKTKGEKLFWSRQIIVNRICMVAEAYKSSSFSVLSYLRTIMIQKGILILTAKNSETKSVTPFFLI